MEPWGSLEEKALMYDIGEGGMFRGPLVHMSSSICISASLFYGTSDHAHPPSQVWWSKLNDIKDKRLFINSVYAEVEFGKDHQSVGSQGLAYLVD